MSKYSNTSAAAAELSYISIEELLIPLYIRE